MVQRRAKQPTNKKTNQGMAKGVQRVERQRKAPRSKTTATKTVARQVVAPVTTEEMIEVFELTTVGEVLDFCKMLLRLKKIAPRSLRYTIAVTARRTIRFKGAEHVGSILEQLTTK